jgi:hypothetical protein
MELLNIDLGITTFFCISDEQGKNEIRIPIEDLRNFQAVMNKKIEEALDDYESAGKDE